jgi:hypothetical protein
MTRSSTLGQRRYNSGDDGSMVVERGNHAGGVRRRRLAERWFSADGDDGDAVEVIILVFWGRR